MVDIRNIREKLTLESGILILFVALGVVIILVFLLSTPIQPVNAYQPDEGPTECKSVAEREGTDSYPSDAYVKGNISLASDRPGDVIFRYSHIGYQKDAWTVKLADGTNLSQYHGFNKSDGALEWDQDIRYPWFTVNTSVSEGFRYRSGTSWAIIPAPNHRIEPGLELQMADEGIIGNQVILVGDYTKHSTTSGCQRINVYVPKGTELASSPRNILTSLEYASRALDVGEVYQHVDLIASPKSTGRHTGLTPKSAEEFHPGNEAIVDASESTASLRNTWMHEYIHTLQSHRHDYQYEWVQEGVPTYLTARLEAQHQGYPQGIFEAKLHSWKNSSSIPLNESENTILEYHRGARAVYLLDRQLSKENKSIEWMMKNMNNRRESDLDHLLDLEDSSTDVSERFRSFSSNKGELVIEYQSLPNWLPSDSITLLGLFQDPRTFWYPLILFFGLPTGIIVSVWYPKIFDWVSQFQD